MSTVVSAPRRRIVLLASGVARAKRRTGRPVRRPAPAALSPVSARMSPSTAVGAMIGVRRLSARTTMPATIHGSIAGRGVPVTSSRARGCRGRSGPPRGRRARSRSAASGRPALRRRRREHGALLVERRERLREVEEVRRHPVRLGAGGHLGEDIGEPEDRERQFTFGLLAEVDRGVGERDVLSGALRRIERIRAPAYWR